MMKRIALLATLAATLATGCGAARPQRPTQTYDQAFDLFVSGQSFDGIATSLALSDGSEARTMVRVRLMELNHRINNAR